MPPLDDPAFLLPLEQHCGRSFTHARYDPRQVPRAHLVEISRLAVHPAFRRRRGEGTSPTGAARHDDTDWEHRTFPLIGVALMMGAMALTELMRRQHGFVMMEPRVTRLFRVSGFPFEQIGELMDYHGQRAAYHLTVADFLHSWNQETLRMYHCIHETLEKRAA
jgi:N-acyl amino acid synthase of PEP-CTERM/exosortase system